MGNLKIGVDQMTTTRVHEIWGNTTIAIGTSTTAATGTENVSSRTDWSSRRYRTEGSHGHCYSCTYSCHYNGDSGGGEGKEDVDEDDKDGSVDGGGRDVSEDFHDENDGYGDW
ncbi:hypothetical protein K501DRAFT_268023 [Backusella circina FSU 941]|nr:hypothetical protein K501DRAFT_268023 [Backusella circina FSU 941]